MYDYNYVHVWVHVHYVLNKASLKKREIKCISIHVHALTCILCTRVDMKGKKICCLYMYLDQGPVDCFWTIIGRLVPQSP